jgi:hypothetical protein
MYFQSAYPGYSELTPGTDFSMECVERHWDFDPFKDDLDSFRMKISMAQKCADFEEREQHG